MNISNKYMTEEEMKRLDEFAKAVRSVIDNQNSKYEIKPVGNRFYYENKFAEDLLPIYLRRCECEEKDLKEFNYVKNHSNYKICSISSSARLCFIRFYNEGAHFEISLPNPVRGNAAQLDAKLENTYFECKSQEVINGEKERLRKSYKKLLETEFGVKNITIVKNTLSFNLKDMGIEEFDGEYDKTHFNIKQLFTHLLAIAKKHPLIEDCVTLRYVIFKPSNKALSFYPELYIVYEELKKEIKAIASSKSIKFFLNKHKNIKLDLKLKDVFVDIDSLETIDLSKVN